MSGGTKDPVYHYHSNYDSYHWMKTLIDPNFTIHTTAGQFLALLTYHLADDLLLPFDIDAYSRNLGYAIRDMTLISSGMSNPQDVQTKINLTALIDAQRTFDRVADTFVQITSSEGFAKNNQTRVKDVNRRLKQMQRVFVRESGLPGRPFYKNALYAPSRDDGKFQPFLFSRKKGVSGSLTTYRV
jgi:N-acetylated-alpha-linked acidic dipeptidase